MSEKKGFIKIEQAAEILQMSTFTIRKKIKTEGLPAYKPGRDYLFLESELMSFAKRFKA